MTRIVLVGPRAEARGGIAQFETHLERALAGDAEVHRVSFARLYPAWTAAGRREAAGPATREAPLIAWRPWTWRWASRRIASLHPDLVVIQWWHPAFGPALRSVARAARRSGSRVAFVCHNAAPHERFPMGLRLSRAALTQADALLALSASTAIELRAMVPGPVSVDVLPHPPYAFPVHNEARGVWRRRIGAGGPRVVFFGYVRPYKGLEDLVRAMPMVRAAHPAAVLAVAGPFLESEARYRELAHELGVGDAVRMFPGYVDDAEVGALLAEADVVALPYRSASQSGVLPLAVAAGVPVVVTDVGGLAEHAGDGVTVVPPRDPRALSAGIVRALAHGRSVPAADPAGGWGPWRDALRDAAGPAVRRAPSTRETLVEGAA